MAAVQPIGGKQDCPTKISKTESWCAFGSNVLGLDVPDAIGFNELMLHARERVIIMYALSVLLGKKFDRTEQHARVS